MNEKENGVSWEKAMNVGNRNGKRKLKENERITKKEEK